MKKTVAFFAILFSLCASALALQGLDLSSSNSGITGQLPAANGGTGIASLGSGVATALGVATNASGGMHIYRAPTVCEINSTAAVTCNNGTSQANNGTFTVSSGATRLEIEMVGGGGGGAGSGTTPGAAGDGGNTCWNTSGAACTSPVYAANGGTKGRSDGGLCTGGTTTGGDFSMTGGLGGPAVGITNAFGSAGGISKFGGAGYGGVASGVGGAAAANSGSGGGGAGQGATTLTGGGGCAGGWVFKIINSPAATYTYAVGAAGTAGTAGTSGFAGGIGGAGKIIVKEY